MAQQGAALQTYNQELVKSIEELKKKRAAIEIIIQQGENQKDEIHKEITTLNRKCAYIDDRLSRNIAIRDGYDRTIAETENAYMKILESSQILLNMVRRESHSLDESTATTES